MSTSQMSMPHFPHCMIEPAQRGKKLFCFGYGYTASYLAERLRASDWKIAGTTTDEEKYVFMKDQGIDAYLFDSSQPLADPLEALEGVTHILLSIPPSIAGDPAYLMHGVDIANIPTLEWVGYLSTIGVYGNQDGRWIDETKMTAPTSRRGSSRLKAEEQWRELGENTGMIMPHFFRMSGIYGPGRSAIDAVRAGDSRRIEKPGHVFNRIHIEDILQVLISSINMPSPGEIYNLADDCPTPSHEVIAYACELLGYDMPPMIPFDQADIAPIVRSFYTDNKRIKNDKIKSAFGLSLIYPTYKTGLDACYAIEEEADRLIDDDYSV